MNAQRPGWRAGNLRTVTEVFRQAVEKHADRLFVDFSGRQRTYRAFDEDTTRLAHGLIELGLKKGEPVAALLDNELEVSLFWFGVAKAGGVVTCLNTALKGDFLRHQLDVSHARIVFSEVDYLPRLEAVIDQLPFVELIVCRGEVPAGVDFKHIKVMVFDEVYSNSREPLPQVNAPGDLVALIFTSGTTGLSKACALSHNYVLELADQIIETDDRQPGDVVWNCTPFFHLMAVSTNMLTTVLLGGSAYFVPRFSVSRFWPEIERSGAVLASLLGAMIPLIAQAEETPEMKRCFGQLRTVAGAPFPPEMQKTYRERFGVKRVGSNCYGTTEASSITYLPRGVEAPPGSSGKRNPDFDVRIVDDNDIELPPGTPGEVIARPLKPHMMFEGFYRNPEATMAVLRNYWYHSGDIGKFDEDGFFYFVDRKKDYLRRRGENISMFELENTFQRHPAISEVAAHSVLSDLLEDDVKITAVLRSGEVLTEESLCVWCLEHVPYYAVPRYIEFRESLPKNPLGKIQKFTLREEGCTPTTWDREKSGLQIEKR